MVAHSLIPKGISSERNHKDRNHKSISDTPKIWGSSHMLPPLKPYSHLFEVQDHKDAINDIPPCKVPRTFHSSDSPDTGFLTSCVQGVESGIRLPMKTASESHIEHSLLRKPLSKESSEKFFLGHSNDSKMDFLRNVIQSHHTSPGSKQIAVIHIRNREIQKLNDICVSVATYYVINQSF
ncbi:hypothetical protein CROQUDRAFT_135556 [Cronartium quercuum f. sp. fusiforme G11]|uniref:Uncharacterized protein n=1 Tax=Cronartium quercuum f. sp. fusiforme G11 TaxID=708437 RepID=A0A9P6T7V0_9BASI|nr:hypothetical protein CROQUDRAFT_135556 [Cronartium quercuum f. sp. fusiforme G11]